VTGRILASPHWLGEGLQPVSGMKIYANLAVCCAARFQQLPARNVVAPQGFDYDYDYDYEQDYECDGG
jgi:hypothetical protein